jgi:tetratricopeptide (TPR) repeat protein
MIKRIFFNVVLFSVLFFVLCGCAGMATSAQEYYAIGMAYYELGKFSEAEKWFIRARSADKTMAASEYNLGRIAFETQRYDDAAKYFENILKKDPDNVLALKAAAYTRIKTGELAIAEKHYAKLLQLVPESADDGYNHALVLYAMEHYSQAEEVLEKYPYSLQDNNEVLLLYARSQKAQDKVEAIDNYAKWLEVNTDIKVRYEYAQILEQNELYARALEEYRKTLSESADSKDTPENRTIKHSEIRFSLAGLLLIADTESKEGVTEIETAVSEGFDDIEAVEKLQKDMRVSAANRDSLRTIVNNMQRASEAKAEAKAEALLKTEQQNQEDET